MTLLKGSQYIKTIEKTFLGFLSREVGAQDKIAIKSFNFCVGLTIKTPEIQQMKRNWQLYE